MAAAALLLLAMLLVAPSRGTAQLNRPSENFPVDMTRPEPSTVTIMAGLGTTLVRQFNMRLAGRRYEELRPDAITLFFYRSLLQTEPDDPYTLGLEFCVHAGLPKPSRFNAFSLGLQLRSIGFRTPSFGVYTIANLAAEQANVTLYRSPGPVGDTGPTVFASSWFDVRCDLGMAADFGITTRETKVQLDPFTERIEQHKFLVEARVGYAFSPYITDWERAEILGFRRPEALNSAFYATIRIGSSFTVQE